MDYLKKKKIALSVEAEVTEHPRDAVDEHPRDAADGK